MIRSKIEKVEVVDEIKFQNRKTCIPICKSKKLSKAK